MGRYLLDVFLLLLRHLHHTNLLRLRRSHACDIHTCFFFLFLSFLPAACKLPRPNLPVRICISVRCLTSKASPPFSGGGTRADARMSEGERPSRTTERSTGRADPLAAKTYISAAMDIIRRRVLFLRCSQAKRPAWQMLLNPDDDGLSPLCAGSGHSELSSTVFPMALGGQDHTSAPLDGHHRAMAPRSRPQLPCAISTSVLGVGLY